MLTDPVWMVEARRLIGVAEVPGPKTNPTIAGWLEKLKAWWSDDATPWCGLFVAHCMQSAGIALPKYWMRAKAWADWGSRLAGPVYGCVVVFERQGGGHVGFVVGRDAAGRLLVLGGNQGDKVCVAAFDRARVVAYVWPTSHPAPVAADALPLLAAGAPLSTNEA